VALYRLLAPSPVAGPLNEPGDIVEIHWCLPDEAMEPLDPIELKEWLSTTAPPSTVLHATACGICGGIPTFH
jgi:hypothetical protein